MALKCEVLLFAQLAEALSAERLTVELPDGATVADCMAQLSAAHEPIRAWQDHTAVAVNEQYAARGDTLTDGDVIALIPPVSGG